MKKRYRGNTKLWFRTFDELLHRADGYMVKQQHDFEEEKEKLSDNLEKEAEAQRMITDTFYLNLQKRLESICTEACSVRDQLMEMENRKSLTNMVAAFAKYREEGLARKLHIVRFRLNTVEDCVDALDQIKVQFNQLRFGSGNYGSVLEKGLNALFQAAKSSERTVRQDDLQGTVRQFLADMEDRKLQILENSSRKYFQELQLQKEDFDAKRSQEMERLKRKQEKEKKDLREDLQNALEEILPLKEGKLMAKDLRQFDKDCYAVNLSEEIRDGYLNRLQMIYEISWMQSEFLHAFLEENYRQIMGTSRKRIFFPYGISVSDPCAVLLFQSEESLKNSLYSFVNTLMFDMLSTVPVGNLTYTVIDPVRKGESISSLYHVKKLMPELFGEKIYTVREEITGLIRKTSFEIRKILREQLKDNQYPTIYDYAKGEGKAPVQVKLLVFFDFPAAMEEDILEDLQYIIQNGYRCAVYTYIVATGKVDKEGGNISQKEVEKFCENVETVVRTDQGFMVNGNRIGCYCRLDSQEARQFLIRYLLFSEEKKNRDSLLPSSQRRMIAERDSEQANMMISKMCQLQQRIQNSYMQFQEKFQEEIVLGTIDYPALIFSESAGYHHLLELFGSEDRKKENFWQISLPLFLDLKKGNYFYLEYEQKNLQEVLKFTYQVMWAFLRDIPVGKVDICVFDAQQRGNSILPYLDFKKRCPDIFDGKIYTDPESIYERLKRVNDRIDEFIQDKLGNKYQNFWEYNADMSSRQETVTLLILYDFPKGMERRSMDQLLNILQNGKKCGIYVMVCRNLEIPVSGYDQTEHDLEEIQRRCDQVKCENGCFYLMPYDFPVRMPELLDNARMEVFAEEYEKKWQSIQKQGISSANIIPQEMFMGESAEGLSIPVGIGDRGAVVQLELGKGSSHHGLIAGATGSGKSTLLHTIIMSSMMKYGPEQLQLYLMDFKSGTEFKIYESVEVPHIRLLALDAMQEFGESILENLVQEMEHRADLFKEEAGGVTTIKDYVEATGKAMPRLLVVIDEFQVLFNDTANRKVAEHCAELAKRIVTEGRAFGIHLLMATQSVRGLSNMALLTGIVEQMLIRIGLKCAEADIRYLFSDTECGKIQEMMKGSIGTAVMNLDYTEKPNIGFRVAYFDDKMQQQYLREIHERFADYPCRLQVFEGKRTEKLLDYFRREGIGLTGELPVRIHLGTPIKVAPPFTILMDKKRKHNLLICGSDSKIAARVADNYMICALLNQNASVYCADGDLLVDDDSRRPLYQLLSKWSGRFTLAEDRGDIIRMIDDLYEQYQSRKKKNRKDAVFVLFRNLQFLDVVEMMLRGEPVERRDYLDEDEEQEESILSDPMAAFDFDSILSSSEEKEDLPVGEKLICLIERGSMYGIYFMVSSLEYQTVRDSMCTYGENTLKHFPERVVFALSPADTEFLLDELAVSGLKDNTVYFTDGVREKLRVKPYLSPEVSELEEYLSQIG